MFFSSFADLLESWASSVVFSGRSETQLQLHVPILGNFKFDSEINLLFMTVLRLDWEGKDMILQWIMLGDYFYYYLKGFPFDK